jgi:cytochrome c-type biogenesis protein CcmH
LKQLLAGLVAVTVMMGFPAAYAVQPDEIMADPAKELRARDPREGMVCRTVDR